jgi:RNA polymerase sigma-70 factor (ECF subfamily)
MDETAPLPTIDSLAERYGAVLYRIACRMTGAASDAEDLVQETFLEAHRLHAQLRDPATALAWLLSILRTKRNRWYGARRRRKEVSLESVETATPGAPVPAEWSREAALEVLESLPEEFRDPLLLFYFEELKYRDIAAALDVPLGTVMSRLARGKAYLREQLERNGELKKPESERSGE